VPVTFGIHRIHILESLPDGELHTGRHLAARLRDGLAGPDHVTYEAASTPDEFLSAISRLEHLVMRDRQVPLLHLEAHGSPHALSTATRELIPWPEVIQAFRQLNIQTQLNLLVSMSCCYGGWLAPWIDVREPAPLVGVVGPREVEQVGDLSDAFDAFYTSLLTESNLNTALSAMGGGFPHDNRPFVLWTATYFFKTVFSAYVHGRWTPPGLDRPLDRTDYGQYFESCYSSYFMTDRYPGIEERFPINFPHDLWRPDA
jgi:hypothetical protein